MFTLLVFTCANSSVRTVIRCNFFSYIRRKYNVYRIAGKFGEEFNLANWRGIQKNAKLKIANFDFERYASVNICSRTCPTANLL